MTIEGYLMLHDDDWGGKSMKYSRVHLDSFVDFGYERIEHKMWLLNVHITNYPHKVPLTLSAHFWIRHLQWRQYRNSIKCAFPRIVGGAQLRIGALNIVNAFHAAGECRRQLKKKCKKCKKCRNCGISCPYLKPQWKMHSDKYKHAWYWFINSLECQKYEKANRLLLSKTKPRVLSVKVLYSYDVPDSGNVHFYSVGVLSSWEVPLRMLSGQEEHALETVMLRIFYVLLVATIWLTRYIISRRAL